MPSPGVPPAGSVRDGDGGAGAPRASHSPRRGRRGHAAAGATDPQLQHGRGLRASGAAVAARTRGSSGRSGRSHAPRRDSAPAAASPQRVALPSGACGHPPRGVRTERSCRRAPRGSRTSRRRVDRLSETTEAAGAPTAAPHRRARPVCHRLYKCYSIQQQAPLVYKCYSTQPRNYRRRPRRRLLRP